MNHPLSCRCGTLQGYIRHPQQATRIVCYCKDCQSFARFLGGAGDILDAMGGTEVVATHPGNVTFTQGRESLACMSLSPRGALRWYAGCCRTPLGNTPRNFKIAYVSVLHSCLPGSPQARDAAFGPVRMLANIGSANGKPPPPLRYSAVAAVLRVLWFMARGRLDGSYRRTPFFDPARGEPVVAPHVISKAERDRLRASLAGQ